MDDYDAPRQLPVDVNVSERRKTIIMMHSPITALADSFSSGPPSCLALTIHHLCQRSIHTPITYVWHRHIVQDLTQVHSIIRSCVRISQLTSQSVFSFLFFIIFRTH